MNKRWLVIGMATIGLTAVAAAPVRAAEKGEEDEVKVSMDDVPQAVRKTLKRESFGAKIKSVDLEKMDGKTVYEADVTIDDENYEIIVDKKGKLLSKKLDDEGAEKASAKEGDEKEHKHEAKADKKEEGAKAKKGEDEDDEKPAKKQKAKEKEEDDEK